MKTKCLSEHATFAAVTVLSFVCLAAGAQDFRVLHHFAGGPNDGAAPLLGHLIQSGPSLYGMTQLGGSNNVGVVFKMNPDGSDFTVMHSFVSAATDGTRPYGSLLKSGSTLYGMVTSEGTANRGGIFRINDDGSDFLVLHAFAGNQGKWPYDTLILSDSTIYGAATYGGNNAGDDWVGGGTLFRMNTNGANYQVLRTFNGGSLDGWGPHGSLTQSGVTLYGSTLAGGIGDGGIIFRLGTNGANFSLLHRFAGGANDGIGPYGTTLLLSDATLYGMTSLGGISNAGTIFKLGASGAGFQLLHSFMGGSNDGARPMCGTLVQSGATLYGVTSEGGMGGTNGTVFEINTNGTAYRVLHYFDGARGRQPYGSLLLSGSTLYGMTWQGGISNLGAIFAIELAPKLGIALVDTNVMVSWSTNFSDFALESSDGLDGDWMPVVEAEGDAATVPISADGRFFRLRR